MTGRLRARLVEEEMDIAGPSGENKRKNLEEDEVEEPVVQYKVLTRNRYESLTDKSDSESDTEFEIVKSKKQMSRKVKLINSNKSNVKIPVQHKPPPIMLHDQVDHRDLIKIITEAIGSEFSIRYIKNAIAVNVETAEHYSTLKSKLIALKINFHSYTEKSVKTKSYVIKGLSEQTQEKHIIDSLASKNVQIVKCAKMRTQYPTYLVSVDQDFDPEELFRIRSVDNTRIYWERYITERRITQCHRCQMWGHATSNCYGTPKCLKCAASHLTRDCVKTNETPAKCANCGGKHPASATICKSFMERQQFLNRNKNERQVQYASLENNQINSQIKNSYPKLPVRQQQYVPAPLPTSNPWQPKPAVVRQPSQNTSQSTGDSVGSFSELATEMKTLNSLVDINKILKLVKQLNAQLLTAKTESEKIRMTINFFVSLDD